MSTKIISSKEDVESFLHDLISVLNNPNFDMDKDLDIHFLSLYHMHNLEQGKGGFNMNDMLIEKTEMNCPLCGKQHIVEKRMRKTQALFKREVIDYEETYFVCKYSDEEEDEFVPAKEMDLNLLKVRDAYRVSKGLLTSSENTI